MIWSDSKSGDGPGWGMMRSPGESVSVDMSVSSAVSGRVQVDSLFFLTRVINVVFPPEKIPYKASRTGAS